MDGWKFTGHGADRWQWLVLLAVLILGGCAHQRGADHLDAAELRPSKAAALAEQTPAKPREVAAARTEELTPSVPAGVRHINQETFEQDVLRSDVPVLVDFSASWCGPCRKLAPTLDELAAESSSMRVVKVDIDDNPELAARYDVTSVPCLMVFKDGEVTARQTGLASKSHLQAMLAR